MALGESKSAILKAKKPIISSDNKPNSHLSDLYLPLFKSHSAINANAINDMFLRSTKADLSIKSNPLVDANK